jgi:hydrogenase expression/formation protein HypC
MRIVVREGTVAICEGRGRRERVDLALVDDPPAGTWILAYHGTAVRRMTDAEAAATSAALDALEAVLAGEADVDAFFADLVERAPLLPPHLAGTDR